MQGDNGWLLQLSLAHNSRNLYSREPIRIRQTVQELKSHFYVDNDQKRGREWDRNKDTWRCALCVMWKVRSCTGLFDPLPLFYLSLTHCVVVSQTQTDFQMWPRTKGRHTHTHTLKNSITITFSIDPGSLRVRFRFSGNSFPSRCSLC